MRVIKILKMFLAVCFVFNILGCEAFVRKFTRKPKKDQLQQIEIVPAPIEYAAPAFSKEEVYRRSFLYWQSWHDELIESLAPNTNHKKQKDCAVQTIKNLEQIKGMLAQDAQKKIEGYLKQLNDLKKDIENDLYNKNTLSERMRAERLKRDILRDYSYGKVKGHLL